MWGCVRPSRLIATAAALVLAGATALAGAAPGRVVSINLCTDQLAMMLAAPGQLVSVSDLAADPHSSAMADAARSYPINHGRAEEVYLLDPDLVLAGAYTDSNTIGMLRRLGVQVVQIDVARSLDETRARIRDVAAALGREAAGARLVAEFDARLAALRADGPRHSAALYHANGYSLGGGTLSDDILRAAGFDNVARELGLRGGGTLPLERLVMATPDLLIRGTPLPGASRSEAVMTHPALRRLTSGTAAMRITSPDWLCGTPHVLGAVARLARAREQLE
jgi:iron complex transport system substrate-binding protein